MMGFGIRTLRLSENRMFSRHILTISALTLSSFLCAPASASTASDRQTAKCARHIEQTITALKPLTDADSPAAAGFLRLSKHPAQSLSLIEQVIAADSTAADMAPANEKISVTTAWRLRLMVGATIADGREWL
jgi:hypothetical protein